MLTVGDRQRRRKASQGLSRKNVPIVSEPGERALWLGLRVRSVRRNPNADFRKVFPGRPRDTNREPGSVRKCLPAWHDHFYPPMARCIPVASNPAAMPLRTSTAKPVRRVAPIAHHITRPVNAQKTMIPAIRSTITAHHQRGPPDEG